MTTEWREETKVLLEQQESRTQQLKLKPVGGRSQITCALSSPAHVGAAGKVSMAGSTQHAEVVLQREKAGNCVQWRKSSENKVSLFLLLKEKLVCSNNHQEVYVCMHMSAYMFACMCTAYMYEEKELCGLSPKHAAFIPS